MYNSSVNINKLNILVCLHIYIILKKLKKGLQEINNYVYIIKQNKISGGLL